MWECPELFSLPVDDGPERRWVLVVSVQKGAPAGGSGAQYFVGGFDGYRFTSDDPPGAVRWADYGADFYAAQAWQSLPDGRVIWLAWMSNWDYARETPATLWRGMMTAPRALALTREEGSVHLVQRLIPALASGQPASQVAGDLALPAGAHPLDPVGGEAFLLEATFQLAGATAARVGLRLCASGDEATTVGYDVARKALYVHSRRPWRAPGPVVTHQAAPLAPRGGLIQLQILVDTASVEVFADGGRVALTSQIFPCSAGAGVELFAEGGGARLVELRVRPLGM